MNSDFLSALKQMEREKNIPMDTLLRAIEDALVAAYKKNVGQNQNVIIEIDRGTGELHIWQKGGHGFGMITPGAPVAGEWLPKVRDWMRGRGLLTRPR